MGQNTAAGTLLTDKQQRFVRAYARSFNATQAAVDAGYCPDRRALAARAAWRLMKKPVIRDAIAQLKLQGRVEDIVSSQRVLEELRRLALADFRSLYRADGTLKPITEWTAEMGSAIQEVTVQLGPGGTRVLKARLWDKTKALEMLAKHLKLLVEHTEVSGGLTISWLPPERGEVVEAVPKPALSPAALVIEPDQPDQPDR